MSDVRCLKCNKKLAEVWQVEGTPVYQVIKGIMSFDDSRIWQICGGCGEKYEVKRQGPGWALIGECGSKIFE